MRTLLFFLSLFFIQDALCQQEEVKNYTWDAIPKFKEVPEEFKNYPAVVLKDFRLYENRVGGYAFKAFVVKHSAVKILTEDGINDYNKVSIDKKYVRDYRDLKVRVIKSNGKIEELPKERIIKKDNSDEKQFVFEGVEKGDIIEYYYVIKDFPEFSGAEYFQRDIPVLDAKFQINNIGAAATYVYGYNGMDLVKKNGFNIYVGTNIPAYKDKRSATIIANLAKVIFFVDTNRKYDYKSYYWDLVNYADGNNAKSMVKKFIADLGLDDITIPLDERLKKMDIYLKENIELDQQDFYKKVFETKKITPKMVLYLYKDVLDYLKINYQFTASTDKFENKFDSKNAVPAALSEILLYIPETKKYLSPFHYWMPYGPPNSACINNDAVIFTQNRRDIKYVFDKIQGVSMNENVNKTESEITLDEDLENILVKKKSYYTGYASFYYRNVMKYIPEDKMNDFIKNTNFDEVDVELKNFTVENKEYKFNYDSEKPFTFNTEVQVKETWLENAGKNYIITLGKVLGNQTNLYQETERTQAIDLLFPRKYEHIINFLIPKGYSVSKLENLIFKKEIKDSENKIIGKFSSSAKVEGNNLKISIEEFYDFTHLEKEKYNEYREVINAAYDFYKSSLILTKV
jgi:hypothetical protein